MNHAKNAFLARQAIESNDIDKLKEIISMDAEVINTPLGVGEGSKTLIHVAAGSGSIESCDLLEKMGVNIDQVAPRDAFITPLTEAAAKGKLEMVLWLLGKNVKIDGSPDAAASPLLDATRFGHIDVVKTLLENGADINRLHNNLHQTACDLARIWKFENLYEYLISKGGVGTIDNNTDWKNEYFGAIGWYVEKTVGKISPVRYKYNIKNTEIHLRICNVQNKGRYKLFFTLGMANLKPMTEFFVCTSYNWPFSDSAQKSHDIASFPMNFLLKISELSLNGTAIKEGFIAKKTDARFSNISWPNGVDGMIAIDYKWDHEKLDKAEETTDDTVKLLAFSPLDTSKLKLAEDTKKSGNFVEKMQKTKWNNISIPYVRN